MSLFQRVAIPITQFPPIRWTVTKLPVARVVAERFVAGETLEQGIEVARAINQKGASVSLDLLGEEVTDKDSALACREEYRACLLEIAAHGIDANISVKLTQLGLTIGTGLAEEALADLAATAADVGTTVTVDMEDSRFTRDTIDIYSSAHEEADNLGVAIQAYLRSTLEDLSRIAPLGGHIRLCKGAYAEPADLAWQSKDDVSDAFAALLGVMMADDRFSPAIATHDDRLIALGKDLGARREAPYEFQMLYGVRTDLQDQLIADGFPLRVYVPYGSQWYPYLSRRLAERPANAAFFFRALIGR